MAFDYDPHKSAINKTKHGVDFEEAKLVWQDADEAAYYEKNRNT